MFSDHDCDDGNTKSGDGCSNICQVERNYVCRQNRLAQGLEVSVCLDRTKVEFTKSEKSLIPLTYQLSFSRGCNLSKKILTENYKLMITNVETPEANIVSSNRLAYTFYKIDSKTYSIELDGTQFESNIKGTMTFVDSSAVRRQLVEREELKDDEGMEVDLSQSSSELDFDYDAYNNKAKVQSIVDNIDNTMGNPVAQTAIFLLSMNPLMFSFSANILNRFVYFRGLKTVIPLSLEGMFAMLGSGFSIRTGKTDYTKPEENKKTTLDLMLGIEDYDQDPPLKFKEMKFTDIYIKSALPIILINFSVYLVVLLIILINKALQKSEIDRLKKIAAETKDSKKEVKSLEMGSMKKAMMKTFEFAELHFKWNAMIRMNLLIYQNFTLGIFLNISKGFNRTGKVVLKVSYALSWISLLAVYCNGYILYYLVEKYYKKNKATIEKKQLEEEELANKPSKVAPKKNVDLDSSVLALKGNKVRGGRRVSSLKNKNKKLRKFSRAKNAIVGKMMTDEGHEEG